MSQLKLKVSPKLTVSSSLPPVDNAGSFLVQPVQLNLVRLVQRKDQQVTQHRIQWSSTFLLDSTWEDDAVIRSWGPLVQT